MQAFYEGELTLTSSRSFIQPALFCLMQGSSDSRELNESWLQRMIQITTHPLLNRLHFGFLREVEVFPKPLRKGLKVCHTFYDTFIHLQ